MRCFIGISFADDRDAIGFSFSLSPMIVMLILIAQSYGGFMSSKVVEANAGIHSLAMAVAVRLVPVQTPLESCTDPFSSV